MSPLNTIIPIGIMPQFPLGEPTNIIIEKPTSREMKPGDILIARYKSSRWARYLPWENWHHAALISKVDPFTIIEAAGHNGADQPEGPTEVLFDEAVGFDLSKSDLLEIKWLRPVFPDPLREIDKKAVKWRDRKIITQDEARRRIVSYARSQTNRKEPYTLSASKWSENKWYCSLLPYKSYSMTVTGMYLEDYTGVRGGWFVTPEDILDSPRTEEYFTWKKGIYHA